MDKFSIANELREISLLLELKKENPYKARAYATGAAAIESVNEDIGRLIADDRLTTIRGIGESLASQIVEIYEKGTSSLLEHLREEFPAGIIELSQVPGLSVKKIQALHDELGISSIKELENACRAGLVARVRGFGDKTQANILEGIAQYESREQLSLLYDALDVTKRIIHHLSATKRTARVEKAGSVRRWKEVVDHISLVASSDDPVALFKKFEKFPLVTKVDQAQPDRCSARLAEGQRVHIFCSSPQKFPAAWLVETGSPAHVKKLQAIAQNQGFTLDEYGLRKGGSILEIETEADIYAHLGLPYIPPELREDVGEIEEALNGAMFDDLIRVEHIQGMTHCHTSYSDGKNTVEQMARAAELMGLKYITITDHSPAAHYAGGLDIDRLKHQWAEIDAVQERVNVRILKGTESDILADGSLDYPDEILDQFDIIIASVHSRMKMDADEMTARVVNCMRKKQFKIWGHALGRLLLRREPFVCHVEEILDAIAESRAAIEVNGDPYRLDMEPRWIREARKRGIRFVISVDAHSTGALNFINFGVHIARRGGLRKNEVLNTFPVDRFREWVKPA